MGAQAAVEEWSNIIDEISSNEGETTENIISANSSWLYGYIAALKAAKMINDEQYQQMMNIMGKFVKKEYEKLENQNEIIVHTFEEIQQYRNIGTVEECKIAMEKQQPKKIKAMRCDCGNILLPFDTFCNECGQKVKVVDFTEKGGGSSDNKKTDASLPMKRYDTGYVINDIKNISEQLKAEGEQKTK